MSVKSLGYVFGNGAASGSVRTTPGNTVVADRPLSAHRVVKLTASGLDYPSLAAVEDGDAVIGITMSASSGATDDTWYQDAGAMSEPSWAWTLGPIWCGDSGVLTQTRPTSGVWGRQIAEAVSATKIMIHLFPTYYSAQGT